MNSKLAVAYSAKKMAKKKIDGSKDLDYMKSKCYSDGGRVDPRAPVTAKAESFQKGFGYDKPSPSSTFDDRIRDFVFGAQKKANGGMVEEDEPIEEAPMDDLHMDDDFLSDEMKEEYDEPSMRKKKMLSMVLDRIKKDHLE